MRQQHEDYDPDLDYEPMTQGPEGPEIDPAELQHYIDVLRTKQHMPMAIIGGMLGAALGAVIWLATSALFGVQVAWMAMFAGALVGVMVRMFGHGIDLSFGIASIILAALAILAGELLSGCVVAVQASEGLGFADMISTLDPMQALRILQSTFDPVDTVSIVAGLAAGFFIARRRVRAREVAAMAAQE